MAGNLVEKGGIFGTNFNNELQKQLKSGQKFFSAFLRQFKPLLSRMFFFEVIVNYCLAYQSRKSYSIFDSLMRDQWNPVLGKFWLLSHSTSDIKNEITQELISLLTTRAGQSSIISSLQKAKYYGILFDVTLDGRNKCRKL